MTNTRTLAIYGNTLSDLDKTSTLEKLGASLLKTGHTAPSYRLFTSEDKQALLCEDKEAGRQIRVEIWQLDSETILDLFEQKASQYHLAKLELSDGTEHLAFLTPLNHCLENNCEEVSRFGGWERFLLKTAEQKSE